MDEAELLQYMAKAFGNEGLEIEKWCPTCGTVAYYSIEEINYCINCKQWLSGECMTGISRQRGLLERTKGYKIEKLGWRHQEEGVDQ